MLIIDAHPATAKALLAHGSGTGVEVIEARSGRLGVSLAISDAPDVVLVDVGLPDGDAVEVSRRVRSALDRAEIIVIGPTGGKPRWPRGLTNGDRPRFLAKPLSPRRIKEVLASAATRSAARADGGVPTGRTLGFGPLLVDLDSRSVRVGESLVDLTAREFDALVLLLRRAGEVVSYSALADLAVGDSGRERDYLRQLLKRLRDKFEPCLPKLIEVHPGMGWRLGPPTRPDLGEVDTSARPAIGGGHLHFRQQSVAMQSIEHRIMAPLVDRFGMVVPAAELERCGWADRQPTTNRLRIQLTGIRKRIRPLGLLVTNVRGAGYRLEAADDPALSSRDPGASRAGAAHALAGS